MTRKRFFLLFVLLRDERGSENSRAYIVIARAVEVLISATAAVAELLLRFKWRKLHKSPVSAERAMQTTGKSENVTAGMILSLYACSNEPRPRIFLLVISRAS